MHDCIAQDAEPAAELTAVVRAMIGSAPNSVGTNDPMQPCCSGVMEKGVLGSWVIRGRSYKQRYSVVFLKVN